MSQYVRTTSAALVWLGMSSAATALNIQIDYSNDTVGFFSSFGFSTTAKAALEAAAADIESAITTTLNSTTDTNSGASGGSNITFDFSLQYLHPTTGAQTTIPSAALGTDVVKLFVGGQHLPTGTLGQGGPGGIDIGISSFNFTNQASFAAAVNNATAAGSTNLSRGGGPIRRINAGSVQITSGEQMYDFPFSVANGITTGTISFDDDTNNNGATDTESQFNAFWHFSHTTNVAGGKRDFYSVALHEILHTLGFSSSLSWDDMVSDTDANDWLGAEAIELLGTGNEVLENDSNHIKSGTMSTRISDGVAQEVVMDPSLTTGTRKKLTWLDLAFLEDIGWDVIQMPMPQLGDTDGDGDVDIADLNNVKAHFGEMGPNSLGDADEDGDTDVHDFIAVKNYFGVTPGLGPGVGAVPEPGAAGLLGLGGVALVARRRCKGKA